MCKTNAALCNSRPFTCQAMLECDARCITMVCCGFGLSQLKHNSSLHAAAFPVNRQHAGARQLLCIVMFMTSLPNSAGVHSTVWMRAFSAATMSRAVWYSSSSLNPAFLCRTG